MSTPYAQERYLATLAVHRAALLTTRVLAATNKGTIIKSDSSPVTIADFGSQALLIHALHIHFPDDSFVGEESANVLRADPMLLEAIWSLVSTTRHEDPEADAVLGSVPSRQEMLRVIDLGGTGAGGRNGRIWMLDPIDGTKEFVKGGQYAIALALVENGEQKVGVLGCPNLNLDFGNDIDYGARINEIRISGCKEVEDATWIMLSAVVGQGTVIQTRSRRGVISERTIERRNTVPDKLRFIDFETSTAASVDKHQRLASSLDASWPGTNLLALQMRYAALAVGVGDVTVRMPKWKDYKEPIWDHVGGMLIYEETGGKITDLDGKAIDFGAGRQLTGNRGIVAAWDGIHHKVLKMAREIYDGDRSGSVGEHM
jgi:3'(2'), 5'-bisphosphate nucleotidase